MLVASVAALTAAALFATASAFQHRSAGLVDSAASATGGGPGTIRHFVAATARHPFWIVGSIADLAGLALHALALRAGPLTLVQPLLVTSVVFALPLRRRLERRRPSRRELEWAAALAAGLVLFLVSATPADGVTSAPDTIPTLVCIVAVGAGMTVSGVAGARPTGARSAAALGAGAGLAFAGVAGLLKQVMDDLQHHGAGAVVASWPLYALIVAGAFGLLLSQLAFRAAPLRASLPAISTVGPIVSLVIGVAVFDEHFRRTPLAVTGEVVGLVVVFAAVVVLTGMDPTPRIGGPSPAPPAATRPRPATPRRSVRLPPA